MKIFRLILGIFLVLGILMLLGAGALAIHTRGFTSTAHHASGIIIDNDIIYSARNGSRSYHPRFTFRSEDGRDIVLTSSTGTNPPGFFAGQQVDVLYLPAMPQGAVINSFGQLWLGSIVLAGLGTVFACIPAVAWLFMHGRQRRNLQLHQTGRQIFVPITGVGQDGNIEVNGRRPWTITAQWQDPATQKIYIFESAPIWFDPTAWAPAGKSVGVWIRPDNPSVYTMDTEFLPKAGNV